MAFIWQILVGNFACVALLISAWMHVSYRLYRLTPRQEQICFGLVVGLAAIVSMTLSVQFEPGIYFDLRIALIEIAALFGGPITLALTATLAGIFRVMMGGAYTLGLAGITIASALGLGAWFLVRRLGGMRFSYIPVFSLFVGALSLLVLGLLPHETAVHALSAVGAPIAVLNVVITAVAALVITYFRRFTLERDILRAALAQAPDFHYVKNLDHRFVATNRNVARHHGRDRASEMVGLGDMDLESRERAEQLIAVERQILETGVSVIGVEEYVAQDGEAPRWYATSKVPLRNRHGELIGLAGVTVDISERKQLEKELQHSRDIVTQATAEMSDGLALFDKDGILLFCNKQYRDLFPRSAHVRVQGAHILDILFAVIRGGERESVPVDMSEDDIRAAAATLHQDKDETFRLFDGRWINLRTRVGQNGSALVVASDITAAKESEIVLRKLAEQMKGLAETDALTGVANRRSFDERLAREIQASIEGKSPLALLLVDVDRFKVFNDSYGHLAGDDCLRKVGQCLRETASRENDLPARYGGEEFAIILPDTTGEAALAIADALRHRVRKLAIVHRESEFGAVTVSVGVAVMDGEGSATAAGLIASADAALYRSKEGGRDRATLSGGDQNRTAHRRRA